MGHIVKAVLTAQSGAIRGNPFLETVAIFLVYFSVLLVGTAVANSIQMTVWSKTLFSLLISFLTLKLSRKSSMKEHC